MLHDLRHAVRSITRAKALTTVLLLSLALGTGANATLYSVMDALLFRAPAGVADPSSLVTIHTSQFNGAPHGLSSYPDYLSLTEGATSLAALAAYDEQSVQMIRVDESIHRARVAAVSAEFFPALGLSPCLGDLPGPASVFRRRSPKRSRRPA